MTLAAWRRRPAIDAGKWVSGPSLSELIGKLPRKMRSRSSQIQSLPWKITIPACQCGSSLT